MKEICLTEIFFALHFKKRVYNKNTCEEFHTTKDTKQNFVL